MLAMVLNKIGAPLKREEIPIPTPKSGELLLKVLACGVCRTDLHVMEGELPAPKLPLILGHQIVGEVVEGKRKGERLGVAWLAQSCGQCEFCSRGRENLCTQALFTGYGKNGGFAEYSVAQEKFCFPLPEKYKDVDAAPLLCAGMIGYRAFRFASQGKRIGLYGFGSSAHLLIQVARSQGKEVYVFTRKGDREGQKFAQELGAVWSGDSESPPPKLLDAAIIFAPVGALVPIALQAVDKAGVVICAGIHMSDIPTFAYKLLWEERVLRSVANLTREDGNEFLKIAQEIPLKVKVNLYPLEKANEALRDLKEGKVTGSIVLKISNR